MLQPLQDWFGTPTVSLFWDIIAQNGRRGLIHKRSDCHYFIHSDGTKSYNYNNKF